MSEYAAEASEPVDVTPEPDTLASDDSAFESSDSSWDADYPEQGEDVGSVDNPVLEDDWGDEEVTEQPLPDLPEDPPSDWAEDEVVDVQSDSASSDQVENPVLADDWDDEVDLSASDSVGEPSVEELTEAAQAEAKPTSELKEEYDAGLAEQMSDSSAGQVENPVLADDWDDEKSVTEQPLPELSDDSAEDVPETPLPDLPTEGASAAESSGDEIENPVLADDVEDEVTAAEQQLPDSADGEVANVSTDTSNDVASAAFGEASHETGVGAAFFNPNDDAYSATGDVPKYDGEYVIDIHGTPDSVGVLDPDGAWHEMTAQQFAGELKKTGWDGKEPIRLFSCDTGKDPNGFAQQLADELGVKVTAPTEPVWSTKNGEPFVTSIGEDGMPVKPPTGTWVEFEPSGFKGALK